MDVCELLIVALFIMLAVVPLAIVMAMVELVAKKEYKEEIELGQPGHLTHMPLQPFKKIYVKIPQNICQANQ